MAIRIWKGGAVCFFEAMGMTMLMLGVGEKKRLDKSSLLGTNSKTQILTHVSI